VKINFTKFSFVEKPVIVILSAFDFVSFFCQLTKFILRVKKRFYFGAFYNIYLLVNAVSLCKM
jgi:hypothetical protein